MANGSVPLLTALAALTPLLAAGGDAESAPTERVSFSREIQPLLAEHCLLCHGHDEAARESDLRLDTEAGFFEDLGGYAAVVPGDPEESELFYRVTADEGLRMPPPENSPGLSTEELELLRRWIEEGAEVESHWAFAPFREVAPPAASTSSPIDGFLERRLVEEGLVAAPEADRRTLLRRLSLDLIGLPPTLEELEAFLADDEPGAYEREVERLLASPHYGEHQARAWLDLARYADSHGFTIDGGRTMWPWRDWVIDALQEDVPFDRFTILQLAGDLLPNATREERLATAFHRNTSINQEGGAKDEENRVNAVLDRVNTTSAIWLGTTVDCAQCHDHKYDPISQGDYFRLYAFFDQTRDGGIRSGPQLMVPRDEKEREAVEAFEGRRAELEKALDESERASAEGWSTFRPRRATGENGPELVIDEDGTIRSLGQNPETSVYELRGKAPHAFDRIRLEALPTPHGRGPGRAGNGNFVLSRVRLHVESGASEREVAIVAAAASFEQDTSAEGGKRYGAAGVLSDEPGSGWAIKPRFGEPHLLELTLGESVPEGASVRLELVQDHGDRHVLGRFRVRLASGQDGFDAGALEDWTDAAQALAKHEQQRPDAPRVLVQEERGRLRETRLLKRGSFLDPGDVVTPGFPAALNHFDTSEPRDRLDLARWLVHPRNALVHRVTVNRWWQELFGRGLVPTENDFGVRGEPCTHPELLEWLAQELVRSGFSRKHVLRTIVTSAAYRRASTGPEALAARELDPENRFIARQSRLRLDAESVRDAALRASGRLSPRVGGPPVQPPQPDGVFAFTQSKKTWKADEGEGRFRRTLYTRLWRSSPWPFLVTFDFPSPAFACTRRLRSNTPLQALTLANDPMVLELAEGLAEELLALEVDLDDGGAGDEARIDNAFERCLARLPNANERAVLTEHVVRVRALRSGASPEARERAVWTAVARVLFNLDEFVTRE